MKKGQIDRITIFLAVILLVFIIGRIFNWW